MLQEEFDARDALRLLEAERITVLHGVPTMIHPLMRDATFDPMRFRSLRTGVIAGGSVPVESWRSFAPEGFLLAGDPGITGEDGCARIVGRRRDTILRGGYRISPRELEDRLRAHPAVDDVCVIGVPHDILGELVCACIVPVEGTVMTGEAIKDFARDTVAEYKVPDLVRFFDEFPMTGSGRVKRRELGRTVALDHTAIIGST